MKKAHIYIEQMRRKNEGDPDYQYHPEYIATTDYNQLFNIWFRAKRSIAEYFVPRSGATMVAGLNYAKYGVERICEIQTRR